MPTVLDWNPTVDPSELVRTIREAMTAGSAVVMPGDCGYVALVNPAVPSTAARIDALREPPAVLAWGPDDPAGLGLTAVVAGPPVARACLAHTPGGDDARPGGLAGTLARRGPGEAGWESGTVPVPRTSAVRSRDAGDGDAAPGRGYVPPDCRGGARSAGRPERGRGGCRSAPGRGTADRDRGHRGGYEIVERGLLSPDEIEKLAARIVLFVCTGNTCRSPLAEGLAKRMLAERLGCTVAELPRRGVWVLSAGVSAYGDQPATPEAVAVAGELGADLGEHRSRAVNPQLLGAADDVIAMTRGHAQALASRFPGVGPAPRLLCGDDDLDDPIGAGLDVYRRCAATIRTHLERFLRSGQGNEDRRGQRPPRGGRQAAARRPAQGTRSRSRRPGRERRRQRRLPRLRDSRRRRRFTRGAPIAAS